MCMLGGLGKFLGREKVKYVVVTVAFGCSVFLTFKSNLFLCLLIVAIYVAYDEERSSHKKRALNKVYSKG